MLADRIVYRDDYRSPDGADACAQDDLEETTFGAGAPFFVVMPDGLSDAGAPGYLLEAEEIGTFASRTLEHGAAAVASSLESRALGVSNGHPRDDIALMVLRRTS